MRLLLLELNNNIRISFLIEQNIDYFTIIDRNENINCFVFSDKNIKFRSKNKTMLLYKNAKLSYKVINVIDNVSDSPSNKVQNWIGIYEEKTNIFRKNPLYTGSIEISKVISKLQGGDR